MPDTAPILDDAQRVRAELVRTLYRQTPPGILAHAVTSLVLLLFLWGDGTERALLLGWFGAMITLSVARVGSVFAFFRDRRAIEFSARWGLAAACFAGAFGCLWGGSPWLFIDPAAPSSLVIVTVINMGLGAGAVVALGPYLPAYLAFALPTQLGLITALLAMPDALTLAIAVLAGYALAANLINSVMVHRRLRDNVRLTHETARLRQDAEDKNRLLETTLNSIGQGIGLIDPDGTLRMSNGRFATLLDAPPGAGARPGALPEFLARLGCHAGEVRVEHTPAGGRTVEIVNHPLVDGSRVLTVTDITPLKQREAALERARESAERANAAKTRFLAAASHDLRQPIHALGLFFETLAGQVSTPRNAPLIARIEDSIGAVDVMLNALLDISKLDAGVVTPAIRPVYLPGLLQRLQTEFQAQAQAAGIRLRGRCPELVVLSDELMLERMLRNLISNAICYTARGGVLVAARRRGKAASIEVFDTGTGIPASQLDEIFMEFHQLGNPERNRGQGLGLGLAIVRRISRLLGHPVEVRSCPRRGSSFRVRVPLSPSRARAAAAQAAAVSQPASGLRGRRVLVLDDDLAILEAMRNLLESWGMKVITAATTHEAAARLRAASAAPQALIIDYRLRDGATGLEAAASLREALGFAVPAVFLSGDTAPDRLREVQESGHPMLHKPVRPAILRATLRELFGGASREG